MPGPGSSYAHPSSSHLNCPLSVDLYEGGWRAATELDFSDSDLANLKIVLSFRLRYTFILE